MLKNNFKVALRSILKNKVFSFVNITGLAIGIAASLLILQYVNYELSYEEHNEISERVYRLKTNRYNQGGLSTEWASGVVSIGPVLKDKMPEVETYGRLTQRNTIISKGDKEFRESRVFFCQ